MRRRVTRRLTRLQSMYKLLKYRKNDERQTTKLTQPQRNRTETETVLYGSDIWHCFLHSVIRLVTVHFKLRCNTIFWRCHFLAHLSKAQGELL